MNNSYNRQPLTGATFVPGGPGGDDYAMPEVVSPAPQRYEDYCYIYTDQYPSKMRTRPNDDAPP